MAGIFSSSLVGDSILGFVRKLFPQGVVGDNARTRGAAAAAFDTKPSPS